MGQVRFFILGLAWLLCGCPVSATGFVDGQAVALASGYFEDSGSMLFMALSGETDVCGTRAAAVDAGVMTLDETVEWIAQNRPADYWHWDLQALVGDTSLDLTGRSLDGFSLDASSASESSAGGLAFHYLRHPTVADLEAGFDLADDYVRVYATDGGKLDITSHTPGESVGGEFDADIDRFEDGMAGLFGAGSRVDAGRLRLTFQLNRCDALLERRGAGGGGG